MELPDWLQPALDEYRANRPEPYVHDGSEPRRGDIVLVESPEGQRRIGIVSRLWHHGRPRLYQHTATVFWCHPYREMATDFDLLIEPTHLPYKLIVHGDLAMPVFLDQIVKVMDRVTLPEINALRDALYSDGESLEIIDGVHRHPGMPLSGPIDPRWRFKEEELYELRPFARRVYDQFLD